VTEFAPTLSRPPIELSGSVASGALRRTERALSGRAWWPAFAEAVDIARMTRSPIQLVYLAGLGSFLAAALLMLAIGSPLAGIPALPIGPFVLRAVLNFRMRRQRALFADQVASHLEEVAASMRSGRSILEALEVGSATSDEPTRREFERALQNERLGLPLEEVLRPIALRMQSDGTEQLAVVAAMQRRTGSSAAEALDRVAEGARERATLRREVAALTAQGRLARWILTALPPVLLLVFQIINPAYVYPLFHTTGGVIAVVLGAVLCLAGSLVMKRIVDIKV
jgi:tight adherence protein B